MNEAKTEKEVEKLEAEDIDNSYRPSEEDLNKLHDIDYKSVMWDLASRINSILEKFGKEFDMTTNVKLVRVEENQYMPESYNTTSISLEIEIGATERVEISKIVEVERELETLNADRQELDGNKIVLAWLL